MTGDVLALLAVVVLLAGNAFFVGAEFAIISARRDRVQELERSGVRQAAVVLRAGRELPLIIAGAQLGITVCSLLLGRLGEPAMAHLIEQPLALLGLPEVVLHPIAFTLALGIVVALHTVIGEMVPKNLAIAGPERAALWLVPAHYAFCRAVRPVLWLFTVASNAVLRVLRVEPVDELDAGYTRGELAEMIADSQREGLLDADETSRLTRTLRSSEGAIRDVMLPLDEVRTLPAQPTVDDVARAVASSGFSRFPLRADHQDGELIGYLHVKDVLDLADQPDARVPPDRVRRLAGDPRRHPDRRRARRLATGTGAPRPGGERGRRDGRSGHAGGPGRVLRRHDPRRHPPLNRRQFRPCASQIRTRRTPTGQRRLATWPSGIHKTVTWLANTGSHVWRVVRSGEGGRRGVPQAGLQKLSADHAVVPVPSMGAR